MQQKTPLFFSPGVESNNKEKESLIEHAKRTVDALIAYNMSLITRFLSATQTEIIEYMLCQFLGAEEIPSFDINSKMDTLKKTVIQQIITDIKLYEKMKLVFDKGDLSHICFSIFLVTNNFLTNARRDLTQNTQNLLSLYLPLHDAKKQTKKIIGYLNTKSNKLPLLVEYNILLDLYKTLTPQLNPIDIKILENTEILVEDTLTFTKLIDSERFRLDRKKKKYLTYLSNPLLTDLIQNFCNLSQGNVKMTSDMLQSYINLCTDLKDIYLLEEQIDERIRMDVAQKKNAAIIIEAQVSKPTPKKEKPVSLPVEEKNSQRLIAPVETMVIMPEPFLTPETETTSAVDTQSPAYIEPAVAEPVIRFEEIVKPLPALTPELQETMVNAEGNEQPEEEPIYFYQPYYKKVENKITPPQNNTLNLDDDDMDTYLKVFGLLDYESINLRALVNLTLHFGGEIETTGGNRCRMKIQNIYAFIAVPVETLVKACNSATVTMHGGGHRSTRSQNHDRENAPDYLVKQFRDAFDRAGFTPANLGLSKDSLIDENKWVSKFN